MLKRKLCSSAVHAANSCLPAYFVTQGNGTPSRLYSAVDLEAGPAMQQDAETKHMDEFFSEVSAIKVMIDHSTGVQVKPCHLSDLRVIVSGAIGQYQIGPGQAACCS